MAKSQFNSSSDASKSVISKTDPNSVISSSEPDKNTKKPKSSVDSSGKRKPKSADATADKSKKTKTSEPKESLSKKSNGKNKSTSSKKSKNKNRSRDDTKKHKSTSDKTDRKSKAKSGDANTEDGYKLKSKPKSKDAHCAPLKHSSGKSAGASDMSSKEKKSVGGKVRKIEATQGATAVTSEKAITASGYLVQGPKLFSGEYSTVLHAKRTGSKNDSDRMVVKVVNLAECSPRCRVNLLQNSVRIMRFISGAGQGPLASVFVAVYEVFVVSGVRLFIFMAECDSKRTLYELVRSKQTPPATDIRNWCQALVAGVHQLQSIGVAHRAIKLQHLLFDSTGNVKLVGWGKSVFFYDPHKKRIQLQRKERRVRRNYHLPPEAFLGSYDPAKADIWSVGVALVAISSKRYPFNVRDKKTKFSSQWRQFIKNHELNTYVRNLCHRTFSIDPKRRISSVDLLNDKYFSVGADKLKLLNCKANPDEIQEDLQVGVLSAIDLTAPVEQSAKSKPKPMDWAMVEKMDPTGVDENATGFEGGAVGEEENLPAAEQEAETKVAENSAPEEAEAEAQPEDGDFAETEEGL